MQRFTLGIHRFSPLPAPRLVGRPKATRGPSPEGPLYQTLKHSFPNDPLLTCCCHWSLFLVPGNREEQRGERMILKVESEPHRSKRKRRVRSRLQTFRFHHQPHRPPYNPSAYQEVPSIPRPSCVLRRSSQEHLVSAPQEHSPEPPTSGDTRSDL